MSLGLPHIICTMRYFMRLPILPFGLLLAASTSALAVPLTPYTYYIDASSNTTGIHVNNDVATLTGTITFDTSLNVSAANLVYNDLTDGENYTFTVPGATSFTPSESLVSANIYNYSLNPNLFFAFSVSEIGTSTLPNEFRLGCGVDCDDDVNTPKNSEEFTGFIAPVPEPSTLALLGTGALGAFATLRRRIRL